jgi:NAD(P)-dependent dehydrogenase (short-subunit alcohol dehydrogenase family)
MNRLHNKTALITGGNSGIGLATARLFLAEGAQVAITGRNQATLAAAEKELGPDALIIEADATHPGAKRRWGARRRRPSSASSTST